MISRDSLEVFISDYGGRVTGSVSGKTSYLVVGYKIEDGREITQGGKYKKAKTLKTPILDEDNFEKLMQDKLGDENFKLGNKLPTIEEVPEVEISVEQMEKTKNDMWTDRYKPRGFQDLVGNQGAIG